MGYRRYLEVAAPLDDEGLGGGVQGEQGRGLQGREGAQVDDRTPLTEKSFHYRMTAPKGRNATPLNAPLPETGSIMIWGA